jgi:hypothetical protein
MSQTKTEKILGFKNTYKDNYIYLILKTLAGLEYSLEFNYK